MRRVPIALLATVLACACRDKDPVVLQLEGETVRASAFAAYVASVEAQEGIGPVTPEVRQGLLDAFLEQRALVIEARRRKLLPPGASTDEEIEAVSRLVTEAVPRPQVSEQEIADWRAAHAAELTMPEKVSLRQVLVATLNEAREVKRKLGNDRDPRTFDSLARAVSKGPEATVGGYMGNFERGQLPGELEQAAFSLPEGGTSEPIQSPLGYHVLRVESRQQAREIPLEEARERIRDQLVREKRAAAERAFVAAVMARAKVNHEAALRPSRPS
jgi:parvulin-like peptidyl-prolyl isomerase